MFFSTASEAKREVKSLISIKTSMNSENMGHLWHKMSRIYLKKLRAPCQISSYFWVFWGKIQLSNGHKVSWFWVGWKILLDLIFPHVGLSSMPFWSKYTDPPTFMIYGFKKEHMLKNSQKYTVCVLGLLHFMRHSCPKHVVIEKKSPSEFDNKIENCSHHTTIFHWNWKEKLRFVGGLVVHLQKFPPNLGRIGCVS